MRAYSFPDIKDRSANSPIKLVEPTQVLGYYNQENRFPQLRVNDAVKVWYIECALKQGWNKAEFLGNQCLLEIKVLAD